MKKYDQKAVERGIRILKQIEKLIQEFGGLQEELKSKEQYLELHLIGGIVAGIYSPRAEIATVKRVGPLLITQTLEKEIEKEENPFSKIFE